MRRLLLVLVSVAAAVTALSAPASAAQRCINLPDADGHVWTWCP